MSRLIAVSKPKITTITLGCRFNFYESEVMKMITNRTDNADNVVIINTCAVTHEAERQSKQAVRKAIRKNVDAKIVVTGCAARTAKDYFRKLDGVFDVIQNENKEQLDISQAYWSTPHLFEDRARAFLQIQNGCDHCCTYCIVPFTRGRSKSLSPEIILKQVEYFLRFGFNEIVLSGIDIASYGKDIGEGNLNLFSVIEMILEKTHIAGTRIRLSSIDPAAVDRDLLSLFSSETRIMPHFHFSIQSGSNDVLKAMKRRHSRENVIEICEYIRGQRSCVAIGGDIITGFPMETEAMFEETVKLVDDAKLALLHVFPYSVRSGTVAASMVNLPKNIIRSRANKLREKVKSAKRALLQSFVGTITSGLIEKSKDSVSIGKTDSYIPFRLNGSFRVGEVIHDFTVIDVTEDDPELMLVCIRE